MESPLKRKSLIPKMFRVFTTYIFLTLAVFFGYVQLFGGVKTITGTLPAGGAEGEVDTTFTDFVSNLMSMKNIFVDDFTLEFTSSDGLTNLSIVADVAFDSYTCQASVDADLIYNGKVFDVGVLYSAPDVFVSIENSTYKFCTESEEGTLDFTGIISFVSQVVGFDTSGLKQIQDSLGIDLENLDMTTIINQLDISSKKTEEGATITISLMNLVKATIYCDKDCNMTSAKLEDVKIKGNVLKLNVPKIDLNCEEILDKMPLPEEENVIDMSAVTDYPVFAQNLFKNDYIETEVELNLAGKLYEGTVLIDNSDGTKVKFETQIEGIELSAIYSNETIFLSLDELRVSFSAADFKLWSEKLDQIIESKTSKSTADFVKELLEEYVNFDEFDFEVEIQTLLSDLFSSSASLEASLPNQTFESENQFSMLWENGLIVTLAKQDKILSSINVKYDAYSANLAFHIAESGFAVEGKYYDLTNLLPLLDVVEAVSNAGQFGGEIDINYQGNCLKLDYVVLLNENFVARVDCEILGEQLSIFVVDRSVLVQVGSVVIEGTLDDIELTIQRIEEIFGVTVDVQLPDVTKTQIIDTIKTVVQTLSLGGEEGKLASVEYLSHKASVSVENAVATIVYEYNDLSVQMTVGATNETVVVPTATDDVNEVLNKVEAINALLKGEQYSFEIALSYNDENLSAKVVVDLLNDVFAIENLTYKTMSVNLFYKNKVLYVESGDVKLKVKLDNAEALLEVIKPILQANGIEFGGISDEDISKLVESVFGEDLSGLTIKQILEKMSISVEGSLDALSLNVGLALEKPFSALAEVKFDGDSLKSVEISSSGVLANIELVEFYEIVFDENSFYDLLSAQIGTLRFSYGQYEFTADVELNLKDEIFVKVSTQLFGVQAQIIVKNNMLYATIGELNFIGNFNDAKELLTYVEELFGLVVAENTEFDFGKIETALEGFNFSNILVSMTETDFNLNYLKGEFALAVSLKCVDSLEETSLPENCEDLKAVLPKVKNILDYINAGVFEFDFTVNYNGLDFAGIFKYANGVFEISNVEAAGEIAYIRIENGVVYFSYGNMKLKFDVPENSSSGQKTDFREVLEKITSDTLGVEIQFGVFEEILEMLTSYSFEDCLNKIVASLTGDLNQINLTISNKKQLSLSQILSANVKFENDNLASAGISIYDKLAVEIKVNYVDESTIKPFVAEEFEAYSADFVAGALDSLEVVPNVYAFSSDVAIRYSKTSFYGEIVAMAVKDETAENALGGYVPALSIRTTSLGLNSYIYLIGETVYIDINGLQICADLNETTIAEVLDFVENTLGISLSAETAVVNETVQAFKVILPAIDQIYGAWISEFDQGLQVRIDDALWYGEKSRFEDIILELFISNYNNIIVPTKLVVGANIYDPNTLYYDDYSDYWLEDGTDENGDKIILESASTRNLNFGAYFTNISVGKFAESVDSVFVIEDKNYQNIHSVMSNYGTTELSDFNSYKTVLTLADSVYSYGKSLQYQVSLNASMTDATSSTTIGGDVVVQVRDKEEDESCVLDLFNGKVLKVQGNLDLNSNGVQHLIDLLYANNEDGLYLSYTHGENIAKGNSFRAKISNTNMSDIISMLLKFANVELSDSMKEAWSIGYCTTDFSYVQSLLGIGDSEINDEISKADVALNSVESITKMLGLIKLDKVLGEDGLNAINLSLQLKLSGSTTPATVSLVLKEELAGEAVVTKLRQIRVDNLVFAGKTINVTIDVQDFDEANFDYDTTLSHIDFSEISSFVDTVVTTVNTKSFNFNGSVTADIIGIVTMNIDLDMIVSIDQNNQVYAYVELAIDYGGIGGIAFDSSFDKRYVTFEYKDNNLTYHRYSQKVAYQNGLLWKGYTKISEDKTGTYASNEIIPNLTTLIKDSFGFSDTAMNIVQKVIDSIEVNPTVEEALLEFACTDTGYTLTISGSNLLGSSDAKDIPLTIGRKLYSGYTRNDDGEDVNKNYSFVDSITGLQIVIGSYVKLYADLYSNNDVDSYTTEQYQIKDSYDQTDGAYICGYRMFTNDYYRKQYISTVGGLY